MRRKLVLALTFATLLLVASAAGALNWQVRLHNGNVFQTRYQPVDASFDDSVTMFLSDGGNWVAIPKAEISEVVSLVEVLGYGTMLDGVTLMIGQLPNDNPSPEEESEMAAEAAARQQSQIPNYTLPLVSEPNAGLGIPLSFLALTTPPLGNSFVGSSAADQRRSGGGEQFGEPFSRDF